MNVEVVTPRQPRNTRVRITDWDAEHELPFRLTVYGRDSALIFDTQINFPHQLNGVTSLDYVGFPRAVGLVMVAFPPFDKDACSAESISEKPSDTGKGSRHRTKGTASRVLPHQRAGGLLGAGLLSPVRSLLRTSTPKDRLPRLPRAGGYDGEATAGIRGGRGPSTCPFCAPDELCALHLKAAGIPIGEALHPDKEKDQSAC